MSFKDELKDSIKTGISEALGEALKTKSFKDIKAESAFNSKSVIEKTLGGVFQTILASNPVTLLLEKNFRLTEKLFSGTKFIGNLTKGLIGNALKNTIGKALQGINKNNKILPNSKQTLVTANKSLNIPAINSLQITSKNCLIKADRITLAYTGTRANLFNSGVMNRFTNTGLLPNLQDSPKLIQAKSIRTVSSSIAAPKLPDKNSLTAIKALQGINKNTMALAKIGKTIVTGIKTLAIPILLIAGHAYPPYCNGSPNDCRGMISSGYDETDQTRILVKLIKSELSALGVEADIANALMAGDSNQMNTSFYKECRNNTSLCNRFDWSRYKYVLEVHFNASSNGSAAGTQLVKKSSSYSTPVDQAIVNAVISNTGKRHYSDYVYSAFDIGYFMNLGIPITYLETEFYDNKSAMDNYSSKKEKIAKDIASAIKQYYG